MQTDNEVTLNVDNQAEANSLTAELTKINELDSEQYFVVDYLTDGTHYPENWTADLVGNGYYKAKYQGATRNAATGEWTGGHWVETGGPSHEDLVAEATLKKNMLMSQASVAIAPLQDAVDLDIATPEEVALLKAWKTYRVLVDRVDVNLAPNIVWPTKPGASA
jgi:hypothetical protein